MRRLTSGQDIDRERGAIAVMVAILMVVLLGSAALAVDFGRIATERGQLQNGADAAALAVADACANKTTSNTCSPNAPNTASTYARANTNDATGVAAPPTIDLSAGTVTVNTTTGSGSLPMTFARVIGIDAVPVNATATATWFYPTSGRSVLPLAFSTCEFIDDGKPHKILTQGGSKGAQDCNGRTPSNQILPGGMAWLAPTSSSGCIIDATVGQYYPGSQGASIPNNACKGVFVSSLLNQVVALPVYNDWNGVTGNGAAFMIQKWAGFRIEGWSFPSNQLGTWPAPTNNNGIYGTFLGYSGDPSYFTGGTTDPSHEGNLYVVKLTK
ncbi:hypothetical protein SCMU_29570 [Sinomonas cyclohexanicum]|uniref:Putative Flp pilus-assembly TadG-like N-terminal domain-containing protein n=1 Tax=Sinomonas cyclohexanicum TaxID=322009 RepID=A0ABM7PY95_SINCY|nr:Tad domain-containing protein [Corynebacterium cyclohexanicum]BCT77115.1 hypothetical protein SCMU_29570 [Corynebacterium cyclohexanicum]